MKKAEKIFKLCPECKGLKKKGCKFCNHMGVVRIREETVKVKR